MSNPINEVEDKFAGFNQMCREAASKDADEILIHHPEVLGDNYEELVLNLNKLADAGLMLRILPRSARGKANRP